MVSTTEMKAAMVNRSVRNIRAELEFLCDTEAITKETFNEIVSSLPEQSSSRAPVAVSAFPAAIPPAAALSNLNLNNNQNNSYNEKKESYNPQPTQAPPPAYNNPPPPQANYPPLAQATALYAYSSTDVGDLELQPNDHIEVTEYLNNEWWKGKSSRTRMEGIFPRSYVKVIEDKQAAPAQPYYGNNYGNMPLETSQMGNGEGRVPGKGEENAKKIGKKLGNAAIFGAGATIGGNLVNSIF